MKPVLLTNDELAVKIANVNASYTKEELVENELLDVLGYLVALRSGHYYHIDIDDAIQGVKDSLELLTKTP